MVLILSRAHGSFPLSTSSEALDIEDIQDPSTIIDGKTADLATTHSQWNLPMRRERMGPSEPSVLFGSNSRPISSHPTNGRKNLEVDTAINYTLDSSSNSLSSASTMASEEALSSEADVDEDEAMDSEDTEIVPKLEEEIDEASMEDIKTTESSGSPEAQVDSTRQAITEIKKKRGRPRKNPPATLTALNKVAKGRSKTGCITCRRRKKKCDEAKPSCHNCQKNSVICEGYPVKEIWRPGRPRTGEQNQNSLQTLTGSHHSSPTTPRRMSFAFPRGLPFLVDGIETDIDRRFLDHFVYHLSGVLTLHENGSNPFNDLLLPMATQHKGLMHSLMALSGSHLTARDTRPAFHERQEHHHSNAISILRADIEAANQRSTESSPALMVEDPTIASTIVQCLISISRGDTKGEYRIHMNGARELISTEQPCKNPGFRQFIWEFFMYHDVCNSLTSLDRRPLTFPSSGDNDNTLSLPPFLLPPGPTPPTGVLVAVLDGLYKYFLKITALRDTIRARRAADLRPIVPYESLAQAVQIDADIRAWDPGHEAHSPRWIAAQLYRQCVWLYLFRTIQASKPTPNLAAAVDVGLQYLRLMPAGESTQSIVLLPLFLMSCAAFEEGQRAELEGAFDAVQAYSNLGNIRPARRVVRRVWEMMDWRDERSWDWESVMADMGIDLLVT